MVTVKDIIRYGERIDEIELEINIHLFKYLYEDEKYLIAMKSGEIVFWSKIKED